MARLDLVDLPVEILDLILGSMHKEALKRLCLVSKNVSQLAQHYLYNDIDLIQKKEAECATTYIGNYPSALHGYCGVKLARLTSCLSQAEYESASARQPRNLEWTCPPSPRLALGC